MRVVVQRVTSTVLRVNGEARAKIGKGLVVYLGIEKGDERESADYLAKKITMMRIFEDDNGKMNLSVRDVGGEVLVVSQFTLLADTSRGNRPSFVGAELPEAANEMYLYFCDALAENSVKTSHGVFGADMKIEQHNDGPVTIVMNK